MQLTLYHIKIYLGDIAYDLRFRNLWLTIHSWFFKTLQISTGSELKGYIPEAWSKHETKSISFEIRTKKDHPYFYLFIHCSRTRMKRWEINYIHKQYDYIKNPKESIDQFLKINHN